MRTLLALCVVLSGLSQPAYADEDKVRYGEFLSRECSVCHQRDNDEGEIPYIFGISEENFIEAMRLYRDEERNNPVMISVAKSLSDEEVAALAAYFASLTPPQ